MTPSIALVTAGLELGEKVATFSLQRSGRKGPGYEIKLLFMYLFYSNYTLYCIDISYFYLFAELPLLEETSK